MIKAIFVLFSILSAFSLSTAFGQSVQTKSIGECFLEQSDIKVEIVMTFDEVNTDVDLHIEDDTGFLANGFVAVPVAMHEYAYEDIDENETLRTIIEMFGADRNKIDTAVFYGNDLEQGKATGLLAFFDGANEMVLGFYFINAGEGVFCIPPADSAIK